MQLTQQDIDRLRSRLVDVAPELRAEVEMLINAARPVAVKAASPVQYVEVTHSDGTTSVMSADAYQRLTALDLAHVQLRVLSTQEAQKLGLARSTK